MAEIVYDTRGPMCLDCGGDNPQPQHVCKPDDVQLHNEDLDVAIKTLQDSISCNTQLWDHLFYAVGSRTTAARRIQEWAEQEQRCARLNEFFQNLGSKNG